MPKIEKFEGQLCYYNLTISKNLFNLSKAKIELFIRKAKIIIIKTIIRSQQDRCGVGGQ